MREVYPPEPLDSIREVFEEALELEFLDLLEDSDLGNELSFEGVFDSVDKRESVPCFVWHEAAVEIGFGGVFQEVTGFESEAEVAGM